MSLEGTISTKGTLEGDTSAVGEIKGKVSTPTVIYTDAYTIAVKNGFDGTVEEWLASLKGEKGDMPAIDDVMSATSENPVQNKAIAEAFGNIDDRLQAVERNGGGGGGSVAVDEELSTESKNPVQNKVVTEELNSIRDYADNINDTANEAKDVAAQAEQAAREMSQDVAWLMEHEQAISDLQGYEHRISTVEQDVNNQKQNFDQLTEREAELEECVDGLQGSVQDMEQRTIPELEERMTFLEDVDVVTSVNGMDGAVQLTAADVGARPNTWMPSHTDVGADKAGTANTTVATHNTKTDAHNDIRLLITALTERLDALANSDDDTLDQMAEVVAYIKANRDLIDQITTGKVSVADIVNNLTTNVSNKPLSAAQGVALKALIDELAAAANSISSIAKTATSGLVDTYTITYTNGTKSTYTVTNGADGKPPVKGTDYFTDADINEIVNAVYAKVADGNGVAY